MLTSLLLFCLCALGRGSITRPWVRPIFYGMSAAREESIFRKSGQHYDWPLFASWDKPWQWLCVARQPWHVASPKRPSHGGRRLDFMGGGQKVKGGSGPAPPWLLELTPAGTMFSDQAASLLAGALNSPRPSGPRPGTWRDSWDPAGSSVRTGPTPAPDGGQARWCQSASQPSQRRIARGCHHIGRAAAACTEPVSFAVRQPCILCSSARKARTWINTPTWRDYGPGPPGPQSIAAALQARCGASRPQGA